MPDTEDRNIPDESEWLPPPAAPDAWAKWEPRAMQVLILHALVIGVVVLLHTCGLVSRRTANVMLALQAPVLSFAWAGLIAFLVVRARERHAGEPLERGRMLVLALDVFTAIFAVMGVGFWLAIFVV